MGTPEFHWSGRLGEQEYTTQGAQKKPDFSPAQPWRVETRFVPCKAAASEEVRRYIPHFVWAVRPCNGSWRTEKPHQYFRPPRGSLPYVEPLSEARTPLADFFSILLSGLFQLCEMGRVGLKLRQRVSLVERDHSFKTSSC
jgi:hypothetical protein